jgi:heat shock protein HslJ
VNSMARCVMLLLFSLLLASCQLAQSDADSRMTLAGTRWQLVELQSMSEEIGISRPANPAQYIMTFNADGTVNLQLDCNRASGSWSAQASSAESGSLLSLARWQ